MFDKHVSLMMFSKLSLHFKPTQKTKPKKTLYIYIIIYMIIYIYIPTSAWLRFFCQMCLFGSKGDFVRPQALRWPWWHGPGAPCSPGIFLQKVIQPIKGAFVWYGDGKNHLSRKNARLNWATHRKVVRLWSSMASWEIPQLAMEV